MRASLASVLVASALLPSVASAAPTVMLNEFYRDTNLSASGNEWMEIVLTADLTAAQHAVRRKVEG